MEKVIINGIRQARKINNKSKTIKIIIGSITYLPTERLDRTSKIFLIIFIFSYLGLLFFIKKITNNSKLHKHYRKNYQIKYSIFI